MSEFNTYVPPEAHSPSQDQDGGDGFDSQKEAGSERNTGESQLSPEDQRRVMAARVELQSLIKLHNNMSQERKARGDNEAAQESASLVREYEAIQSLLDEIVRESSDWKPIVLEVDDRFRGIKENSVDFYLLGKLLHMLEGVISDSTPENSETQGSSYSGQYGQNERPIVNEEKGPEIDFDRTTENYNQNKRLIIIVAQQLLPDLYNYFGEYNQNKEPFSAEYVFSLIEQVAHQVPDLEQTELSANIAKTLGSMLDVLTPYADGARNITQDDLESYFFLHEQLIRTLRYDFAIEIRHAQPGSSFDPTYQSAVESVETHDQNLHGTIVSSFRVGVVISNFVDRRTDGTVISQGPRTVQQEKVKVYKFQGNKSSMS